MNHPFPPSQLLPPLLLNISAQAGHHHREVDVASAIDGRVSRGEDLGMTADTTREVRQAHEMRRVAVFVNSSRISSAAVDAAIQLVK